MAPRFGMFCLHGNEICNLMEKHFLVNNTVHLLHAKFTRGKKNILNAFNANVIWFLFMSSNTNYENSIVNIYIPREKALDYRLLYPTLNCENILEKRNILNSEYTHPYDYTHVLDQKSYQLYPFLSFLRMLCHHLWLLFDNFIILVLDMAESSHYRHHFPD